MLLEAIAAGLVGLALLWVVFEPMLGPPRISTSRLGDLDDIEETRKGLALTALKEIEFDRETGKLSDADYAYLKSRYTSAAIEALREEEGVRTGMPSSGSSPSGCESSGRPGPTRSRVRIVASGRSRMPSSAPPAGAGSAAPRPAGRAGWRWRLAAGSALTVAAGSPPEVPARNYGSPDSVVF